MPRTKNFDENQTLEKAMELFWKKGFHATSMQELVDFLQISRASIYDTYGDKKSLFDKSFALYRENSKKDLEAFFYDKTDVKKAFDEFFKSMVEYDKNPECKKGCFIVNTSSALEKDSDLKFTLSAHRKEVENIFSDFIQKNAQNDPELKKESKQIATSLYVFMTGLKSLEKSIPEGEKMCGTVHLFLEKIFS